MTVLFFAGARDAAGVAETTLALDGPVSVEDVWRLLTERFPGLAALRATSRMSRNGEYADDGTRFENDDEVAVIPPVSGG